MRPRCQEPPPQDEVFRNRLENLIDQRHELVRLAALIDWEEFDRQWGRRSLRCKGRRRYPRFGSPAFTTSNTSTTHISTLLSANFGIFSGRVLDISAGRRHFRPG